jgi:hypothetical protein
VSETIRTSEAGWLTELASAYQSRTPVVVVDDGRVGLDPANQTLFDMGRAARLSTKEIVATCIASGMGVFGAGLVVAAILDPDPTSKLGLLIASGAVLAFSGGFTAIYILTKLKPPSVKAGPSGIAISWN